VNPLPAHPIPGALDVTRPHPARMYDYYLGGKDHWQADREAAEQILAVAPEVRAIARSNRAFLRRAVTYLAKEKGVSQFLDIGTGIPTSPNVHETAAAHARDTRVVYADNDRCKSGCAHDAAGRLQGTHSGTEAFRASGTRLCVCATRSHDHHRQRKVGCRSVHIRRSVGV